MKASALALIAISISIICILNIGFASALNQNEISVSPSWSTPIYYQGDSVSVKLILTSNSSEELKIYFIGIHFDWMASDSFYGRDLSADPVVVSSYKTYVFDPMAINIPANVSVGSHSYFIGIEGTQGTLSISFTWDSEIRTMQIQDSNSKVFNELIQQVNANITKAVEAEYQSAEAQSLLEQAANEYAEAWLSSGDEKWEDAIIHLQNADSYLEQAEAAEQRYAEQSAEQQRLLSIVVPIVVIIVVIIVVVLIAVIVRKRRKQPEAVADQPLETQDFTPE